MTESTSAGALPKLVSLNDGTAVVGGERGEVRLSSARTRWWNGIVWQPTSTSTPPAALRNQAGTEWWDGEEWRPVTNVRAWYLSMAGVAVGLGVAYLIGILYEVTGAGVLLALDILAFVAWWGFVIRANFLRPRAKVLIILLGFIGMGIEWLVQSQNRRSRDLRVAASASRL